MKLSTIIEDNNIIISAHVQGRSGPDNEKAFGNLINDIRELGLQFKIKSGRWRGRKEPAIHVQGLSLEKALELMDKYKQEAILYNGIITNHK